MVRFQVNDESLLDNPAHSCVCVCLCVCIAMCVPASADWQAEFRRRGRMEEFVKKK